MQSFESLSKQFSEKFNRRHFPAAPASLYGPNEYFLGLGGKRIRPVLCLMGNDLFDEISPDAWYVATALELFHNFTLIHDDIMDNAPLRRGMETVHHRYGSRTAILAGDVMLVTAYEYLNKINSSYLRRILNLFNKTAAEVCEGQQMDIDFEDMSEVGLADYIRMIELKTSVLLAASLKMGAILGGAGLRNQDLLFEFGKKLGIAFQVQDDYLDAFGDPEKFGKQVGGDIIENKKTFLMIHAFGSASSRNELASIMKENPPDKIEQVIGVYKRCKADEWALELKNRYFDEAMNHLSDLAVLSNRKEPLREMAQFLFQRDY